MGNGLGRVVLIGAGPGDPELLTVRAYRAIQRADVVLYDALVSDEILALAEGALRIDVGKIGGGARTEQDDIHAMLLKYAAAGHTVVRLKGGDAFVFGRGGEEALFLRAHGVPVELVPGITSAIAAPASAGIPVTHRKVATHFTVITGQASRGGDDALRASWANAARLGGTLVFLMAVRRMGEIMSVLQANGMSPDTPAALVQSGTCDDERVVVATIDTIEHMAREQGIGAPAVLVIGEVVRLQPELASALATQAAPTASYTHERHAQ